MTLQQIINAIDSGRTVHWSNDRYTVKRDRRGQFVIVCDNGSCIGLTWTDGVTLNGKTEEFYSS